MGAIFYQEETLRIYLQHPVERYQKSMELGQRLQSLGSGLGDIDGVWSMNEKFIQKFVLSTLNATEAGSFQAPTV